MQLFQIIPNGEIHEILDESTPIKNLLTPDESYILCDDEARIVYLWKGMNAKVRSKFIGARKLQDVRSQVGLNYRSMSLDQDEVDPKTCPEFVKSIEKIRTNGFAREIREEGDDLKFEIGNNEGPTQTKTYSQLMNTKFNQNIQQSGPMYTGDTKSSHRSSSKLCDEADLQKIIKLLDEEDIPEGYMREMVIIGDTSYSVTEKVQTFFGKKQVNNELEPISSLPEGIFFAESYVPRVLVQNQAVVAIEFLKKKG